MKATIEIPDELYRRVKAKSALEGRPVREVAEEMFRRYVGDPGPAVGDRDAESGGASLVDGEAAPSWFGSLRRYALSSDRHDIDAIQESIARGIAAERLG